MKAIYLVLAGAVVFGAFIMLLRAGYFLKFSAFFDETVQELKKCTWPTWDELVGSTVVVIVAVALIGLYTVGIDLVCTTLIRYII